jgi:eukaryotic-like serine/threonine-protein kinase
MSGARDAITRVVEVKVKVGEVLRLDRQAWTITAPLGSGGFGAVYVVATPNGDEAVAKFVPKDRGANRELLIGAADTAASFANVIPNLDRGEHGDCLVLVMPRGERSLADYLAGSLPLSVDEAVVILTDVAEALAAINGAVVHRDIKPGNVLLHQGKWCLADFGIARYAAATSSTDTQKFAWSAPFAAPEQWRLEHADEAVDVYAFGLMAYLMLAGRLPFTGPTREDFREQHLNQSPPPLTAGTTRMRDLVDECLVKEPGARPTPEAIVRRLARISEEPASPGFKRLAEVHQGEVRARTEALRQASVEKDREEKRQRLHEAATALPASIANRVRESIQDHAPTAVVDLEEGRGSMFFVASLRGAKLGMSRPTLSEGWQGPFDVVSEAVITVNPVESVRGYAGRTHSLWFCDVFKEGQFAWYELAFMEFAFKPQPARVPFALAARSAQDVFTKVIGTAQLAWPIEELDRSELDEFLDRWLGWFAAAAAGELQQPTQLPERSTPDNWRS